MRHAAGQLSERVQLLQLGQLLLNPLHLLLVFAALGDERVILAKPSKRSQLVANGVDDHAGPEERAVLPDARGLFLVAAGLLGQRESARAGRPAAWSADGVEGGEMPSDDFFRRVALDALRRPRSSC